MHICHGDGAVLNPYIRDFGIGDDDDGRICAGQHPGGAGTAFGQMTEHVFVFDDDEFPWADRTAGSGQKSGLNDLCQCCIINRCTGVFTNAVALLEN